MSEAQPIPTYMLDTNVFNHVLDGKLSLVPLKGSRLIVSGIQHGELDSTGREERRLDLLATFQSIKAEVVLASSFAWGIKGAGFDEAEWNDGSGLVERMKARLKELDEAKKKRPRDPEGNRLRDVLIAETSIKRKAILITGDENLRCVTTEFGGSALDFATLPQG